jgi:tetratricopeptide (TPR) repeat protein
MKLSDRSIRIVTVHPSATVRQLLNQDLRGRGYQDVIGVADLSEVVMVLESQPVHWVITPPFLDAKVNIFQLLKLASEEIAYVDLRFSLILDERMDPNLLSKAFDLGLLSYHDRMHSKLDIEIELKSLFDRNEQCLDAMDLVSAEYLRTLLIIEQRFADLLRFEKTLFALHRGNLGLSFRLAEAQLRAGEKATAAQLLSQIAVIDPDRNKEIAVLWEKFEKGTFVPLKDIGGQKPDMIGVRHAVIIDADLAQLSMLHGYLKELGVARVEAFQDSAQALKTLELGSRPEVIIFEWQSSPLSGPIFAQRVREIIGFGVPLTVVSEELRAEDMPILKEMGVTSRITKPFDSSGFFKEFLWLVHQDRVPTEPFMILQKIKHAIAEANHEELAKLTKRYMESPKCTPADKTLLQAELSYFRGHFSAARDMALNTLKTGMLNVDVLNTLGKSLMKMRDFETALRCFESAEIVSPNNVRRVCNIAESSLELGDIESFHGSLERVKDLDPDSIVVQEVELKGALVEKDKTKAQALMQSLKSLVTILSFTNNRAIALIRCDHFDEGVDLYREALTAVPRDQVEIKGILQYNLALALARLNRLDEAKLLLMTSEVDKVPKIAVKGRSLLNRINRSLVTGERFAIKQDGIPVSGIETEVEGQSAYDETLMALKVGPGDFCLHKIWFEARVDPKWKAAMERPIAFKRRNQKVS